VSTRDGVLVVWVAIALLVVAGAVVAGRSGGRLPGYGTLARVATDGPVRRTVCVLGWMWLGWHAFAR
jgi:hypothetical protein